MRPELEQGAAGEDEGLGIGLRRAAAETSQPGKRVSGGVGAPGRYLSMCKRLRNCARLSTVRGGDAPSAISPRAPTRVKARQAGVCSCLTTSLLSVLLLLARAFQPLHPTIVIGKLT